MDFACICVSHGLDERMEKVSDRSGEFLGYEDGYVDSWNTWVRYLVYRRSRRYILYSTKILRLSTVPCRCIIQNPDLDEELCPHSTLSSLR
jgi:hypothetical protein